ncbi:MAG: FtsW/RodA/SpoVE family cell cycle protein [Patescibacteria group bacterium]|nr:FtsW/RodA/SpoVE family cell cycle protein [Patescibacteria group bacterium]
MWFTKSNDQILFALIFIISILGLINFFSASYYYSLINLSNPYLYFLDNFFLRITILGWLVFIIGSLVGKNFSKGKKFFLAFFVLFYVLILLAFLPPFRLESKSARWIMIGDFSLQPSELIKPFALLLLIIILSEIRKVSIFSKNLIFLSFATILLLPIFFQPSLSNVLIIFISLSAVYFSFIKSKGDFIVSLVMILLFLIIILVLSSFWSYRKERLISFITKGQVFKERYFQVEQSTLAVSSGGLWGKGLGKSEVKIMGLPQMLTDSIFVIYAEEWGFVGVLLLIFLFSLMIVRIIFLGIKTNKIEKMAFCLGVASWLFFQAFLHIGSNIGFLAPTGVVMPFFSQGASGQLAIYFSLGMIYSFKDG